MRALTLGRFTLRAVASCVAGLAALADARPARADEADACADAAEEGQALRDQARLIEAQARFLRCAQSACPKPVRDDCASFLDEVKKRVPSIVLRAEDDAGADVSDVVVKEGGVIIASSLDGTARDVNPGPHTYRFESPRFPARELKVVVAEGEQRRIVKLVLTKDGAKIAPPSTGEGETSGPGPLPWIIGGVGIAGLATFGILQGVAWSEHADVEERCGAAGTCTDEDLDPLRAKFIGSAVGLGVGVAGIATSAILFLTLGGDAPAQVSVSFDRGAGTLRLGSRF